MRSRAGRSAPSAAAIPFDGESYHSFFICTANCDSETDAEYELLGRGSQGRTPWIFDVGANVTWQHSFGPADMLVKLAVYNLLNQERVLEVDESYDPHRFGQHLRHGHCVLRTALRAVDRCR